MSNFDSTAFVFRFNNAPNYGSKQKNKILTSYLLTEICGIDIILMLTEMVG